MRNEKGFVLITTLLILCLLTIIGITSLNVSNTELKIATNHQIHVMEFYGADSAFALGPMWAEENITPGDLGTGFGPDDMTFSNGVKLTTDIECLATTEPITGMPDIRIQGESTHPRGGVVKLEQIFTYRPAFPMPDAPLWVFDGINITGSANIALDLTNCPGVTAEIMYDLGPVDDVDDKYCDDGNCDETLANTPFPMGHTEAGIQDIADAGDPITLIDESTVDEPVVIFADGGLDFPQNTEGWGIIFVKGGEFRMNSGSVWNGIIITSEVETVKLNGGATVNGGLVVGDSSTAVETINGNFTLNFDCDMLAFLYEHYSSYRPTPTWRYI